MPFWSKSSEQPATKDFTSSDESDFSDSVPISTPSANISGGGGSAMAEMQQFAQAIQEQTIVQATINNLTDKAFEACISRPNESLSGKEAACIQATTMKWLDTNQFMVKRMEKKMGAGQQSQQF
jgi:hypothetical protein